MNIKTTLLAAAAALAVSGIAQAAPIAAGSQLNISGFDRAQPDNGTTTLDMATGLDFTTGSGPTPGTAGILSGANGSGYFRRPRQLLDELRHDPGHPELLGLHQHDR